MELKRKKKYKSYLFIIIGSFLILLGFLTIICNKYSSIKIHKEEEKRIELFLEEQENSIPYTEIKKEKEEKKTNRTNKTNYIAILEIPSINLKKGLVNKTSKENNIDKNIYIIKESSFPKENSVSHIILASHSGNSKNSFFKELRNLKYGNKVYLHYNGKCYEYEVSKKYKIEKNGTMVREIYEKDSISLITCLGNSNKQLVVVATLKNII